VNGGTSGLHVRRRGGRLAVSFRSAVLESAPLTSAMRVESADGRLIVRGRLSSGSTGWVLSARASCYRRTIRLEISAVRRPVRPRASVEDHEYEAVIEGAGTGRYLLRVNHVWLLSPDLGEILVMPAYEGAIAVVPGQSPGTARNCDEGGD
jgi:hypothetical protein